MMFAVLCPLYNVHTLFILQEPVIKIKLSNMKQLFKRRYLLKHVVCTVLYCCYDACMYVQHILASEVLYTAKH